jgi:23S rRNA (adenine2503-C2)-methyltransferase
MENIKDLTLEGLTRWLGERGERPYRARQVFQWLYQRQARGFEEMTDIAKPLRGLLAERFTVGALERDALVRSADGSRKFVFRLGDGKRVETVLMPNATHYTLCVSTQVGCAISCDFCMTARMGLERNLTAGEIVQQVVESARYLRDEQPSPAPYPAVAGVAGGLPLPVDGTGEPGDGDDDEAGEGGDSEAPPYRKRLRNIVYMGMGEPFHNYDNVAASLDILREDFGFGFSWRRMTVSTSGLVPAIRRFGQEPTRANLAISLNGATDEVRNRLMPVNRRWNIAALMAACREFPQDTRYRITFEYILIAGVTDSLVDARRLVRLLHGIKCKVNLIPYNAGPDNPYQAPPPEQVRAFQEALLNRGILATVRISKAQDIAGACGQLITDIRKGRPARAAAG